jgi:hypothetical protein
MGVRTRVRESEIESAWSPSNRNPGQKIGLWRADRSQLGHQARPFSNVRATLGLLSQLAGDPKSVYYK